MFTMFGDCLVVFNMVMFTGQILGTQREGVRGLCGLLASTLAFLNRALAQLSMSQHLATQQALGKNMRLASDAHGPESNHICNHNICSRIHWTIQVNAGKADSYWGFLGETQEVRPSEGPD